MKRYLTRVAVCFIERKPNEQICFVRQPGGRLLGIVHPCGKHWGNSVGPMLYTTRRAAIEALQRAVA